MIPKDNSMNASLKHQGVYFRIDGIEKVITEVLILFFVKAESVDQILFSETEDPYSHATAERIRSLASDQSLNAALPSA